MVGFSQKIVGIRNVCMWSDVNGGCLSSCEQNGAVLERRLGPMSFKLTVVTLRSLLLRQFFSLVCGLLLSAVHPQTQDTGSRPAFLSFSFTKVSCVDCEMSFWHSWVLIQIKIASHAWNWCFSNYFWRMLILLSAPFLKFISLFSCSFCVFHW